MPVLDSCINAQFEPGNIGASSGTPPTVIVPGSGLDPGTYDPESVTNSLDFSKFYNSMYLLLLMAGGGPATLPGPTGGGSGGGAGGGGGAPAGEGNISLTTAEQQNTFGFSEDLPKDVPIGFDWYNGYLYVSTSPPSGMTAMTGYGHIYQIVGTPDATIPGLIEVRNMRSYLRLAADKSWVQAQDTSSLGGAHFVGDFSGNASIPMDLNDIGGLVWTMDGPPVTYNNHWWMDPRGTYTSDTIDGAFVIYEVRVTDPAAANLLVAGAGIDWWLNASAPYVDPVGTNNPAAGIGNWVTLTTTFKPVCFYSAASTADFELSLPPPVIL